MNILKLAILTEGFLVLLALGIAMLMDFNMHAWIDTRLSICIVGIGLGITLAYTAMQGHYRVGFQSTQFGRSLIKFMRLVGEQSLTNLAIISILAGVGEELLFRGVLQEIGTERFGAVVTIVGVSILFGLLHAVSTAYFLYAMAMSILLGVFYHLFNDLIAAMLLHAVYDFVALYLAIHVIKLHQLDEQSVPI